MRKRGQIGYLEHVGLREAKVPAEVHVVEVDERVGPVPEHARLPGREREKEAGPGILINVVFSSQNCFGNQASSKLVFN